MGAEEWKSSAELVQLRDRILNEPVNFFTSVSLLERLTPQAGRVGSDASLQDEAIAFRHSPSFASETQEVQRVAWVEIERMDTELLEARRFRFELITRFLGLSGADSPLPLYLSEGMAALEDEDDPHRDFLDIIHNRITALFFRSVSKYEYGWEVASDASDALSARALALAGIDSVAQEALWDQLSRAELLRLGALFVLGASTARSLEMGLRALLRQALSGVPLELRQLSGGWVSFDPSQTNKLGRANNEMGNTFVIGTRVRHPAGRARVTIGPMSREQARTFEPGSRNFLRIRALLDAMCTEPIVFDLELVIRTSAHARFVLGRRYLGRDVALVARPSGDRIERVVHVLG